MALSDQLSDLAVRAKEAGDRAAAAQSKAKADLQQEVQQARDAAQARADALRASAEAHKGKISAWWDGVGRAWHDHVAAIRRNVRDKQTAHDLKSAQRAADRADGDAAYAIDYARAAIAEAEYAVLDAVLAHQEVDELAATGGG